MTARSAKIKAGQMGAVAAGAGKRAVVTDLVVGKGADQEIALTHVRKRPFDIERRARKTVNHRVGEIGCVLPPEPEHGAAMLIARAIPIARVAVKSVGQF